MHVMTRAVTAVADLLILAGCGGSPASTSHAVPYVLYTHCGIDWIMIDGQWYRASPALSDGNGNPPGGWGNPDQQGTIRIISSTEAEFTDSAGHYVLFVRMPSAPGRSTCS